jgi:hypothetical protein
LAGHTTAGADRSRAWPIVAACFLVPLVVASALLRVAVPPNPDYPWHPTLTAKWDHIRSTSEHYDVVFVGDSRVFRGIDPFLVESELERLGCPASVYNLGTVAMTKLEYDRTMEILEDVPGGTPEIVVTVDTLSLLVGAIKDFSIRHRVFLTADAATEYVDYLSGLPVEMGMGRENQIDLAAAFAIGQVPQGAIHQRLFSQRPGLDEERMAGPLRGYEPWDEFWEEAGPDGRENLFATLAPELANGGWERRWADVEPSADELERWITTLEAHSERAPSGSQPVHMLIPSFYDGATTAAVSEEWNERHPETPLFNLVDEELVGDYSDPSFFIDYWHLSQRGSDSVSVAAAAQLCPVIQANAADER